MDDALVQGQEGQFRQIVEMAPYAIVMIGEGGLIEMVNRQAETIFGYSRVELLGQAIEVLLPERFRRVHPAHRANFVADPSPRLMGIGRDLYGRRKDGGEFPIEIGLTPIKTAEGSWATRGVNCRAQTAIPAGSMDGSGLGSAQVSNAAHRMDGLLSGDQGAGAHESRCEHLSQTARDGRQGNAALQQGALALEDLHPEFPVGPQARQKAQRCG